LPAGAHEIREGGVSGSIIGRNSFRRPREETLALLDRIIRIHRGEEGRAD